jgi:hypothetical protein
MTRQRNDKDNSIAWRTTAANTKAIEKELNQCGWVNMRAFARLCGTHANGSTFQRKVQKSLVRNIIIGPHVTGVIRMFKADDAPKVIDCISRMSAKEEKAVGKKRARNSSGRFSKDKQTTLFDSTRGLSQEDIERIAKHVALCLSTQTNKETP